MNFLEAVKALGLNDAQIDEIERSQTDEVLQADVVLQLDRLERGGTAKSSLERARRYGKKFQELLKSKGYSERMLCR